MSYDDPDRANRPIDPDNLQEVRRWAAELGCSERVIRDAIAISGPDPLEVRKFVAGVRMGEMHRHDALKAREVAEAAIARIQRQRGSS